MVAAKSFDVFGTAVNANVIFNDGGVEMNRWVVAGLCVMLGGCFGPTQREYDHLLQEKNMLALEQKPLEVHIQRLDQGFMELTNQYGQVHSSLNRLEASLNGQNERLSALTDRGPTSASHLAPLEGRVKGLEQWLAMINSSQQQILERLDGKHVRVKKKVANVEVQAKPKKSVMSQEEPVQKKEVVKVEKPVISQGNRVPGSLPKKEVGGGFNPVSTGSTSAGPIGEGENVEGGVFEGREGSSNEYSAPTFRLPQSGS